MLKVLSVLSIAIVAMGVACGGDSRMTVKMTVEEYAAACEALSNQHGLFNLMETLVETEDINPQQLDAIEDSIAEARLWTPPTELEELHEVIVRVSGLLLSAIRESGLLELLRDLRESQEEDDIAKAIELSGELAQRQEVKKVTEVETEIFRILQDLSPASIEILANSNCLWDRSLLAQPTNS